MISGCAISSITRAKHRCTGGWLILCCWVIRGQCRVRSQGSIHNGALVVSMQGNIRAWTRNLKKKINIDSFNFITWMGRRCDIYIYIYIYFLITVIIQQKHSSILHWIILILALGSSLNLHIFEFSQFRPDLIAPINFGSRRTSPWSPQVSAALWPPPPPPPPTPPPPPPPTTTTPTHTTHPHTTPPHHTHTPKRS